jgi:predicted component of type VI protein secretion system
VKTLLPEWWLVHPAGPAEVAALAAAPLPRTVVWLDELERYLDGERGLTGGVVRALLNAPHPAAIIGTLWPDRYTAYTRLPAPGGADQHAREREVLDLTTVIRISPEFSAAEQDRARAAAVRDRRLAVALDAAGYGLTQTLAAAPQLVARWQDARTASPYAWAVLTAALDVARLGARAPLRTDLLRGAAVDYCTSQQQAEAPGKWFEQALAYATAKLHGAAAALSPVGAGMGQVAGYTVADYLIQHASRERRYARVPASAWDAVLSYVRDPDDAARLADSAESRLLYRYAIPLYRHAADAGDGNAFWRLADLLAQRGDLDELRARADAGDGAAAWRLADLLAQRGDLDELRARADAGDQSAASQLANMLGARVDPNELRARAHAGDEYAAERLAELLAARGDLDELRARADAGGGYATERLDELLHARGDVDELRARVHAGDPYAVVPLVWLVGKRGGLDMWRAGADAGDWSSAEMLARMLAQWGELDELRARADASDGYSAERLAELLARRGDLDELRARADAGDRAAASQLADLLAARGDLDELRARADAGDRFSSWQLVRRLTNLMIKQGRDEEAERLRRFGLNPNGSTADERRT